LRRLRSARRRLPERILEGDESRISGGVSVLCPFSTSRATAFLRNAYDLAIDVLKFNKARRGCRHKAGHDESWLTQIHSRAASDQLESLSPLYLFVLASGLSENRFALFGPML
jgi:hypothetical protein